MIMSENYLIKMPLFGHVHPDKSLRTKLPVHPIIRYSGKTAPNGISVSNQIAKTLDLHHLLNLRIDVELHGAIVPTI